MTKLMSRSRYRFAGFVIVTALALSNTCLSSASAADCPSGTVVEGTGTVGDIFKNKRGTWTMAVGQGKARCLDKFIYVISAAHPPAACAKGARFTAKFSVQTDDFMGADFDKLVSLSCE